jgi:hypothetical protein
MAGMTQPLFDPPSIRNPEVAAAVAFLRATGDTGAALERFLAEDSVAAIRGLAQLAHWWGSQLYGDSAALEAALTAWKANGDPMPPPAPAA